MEAGGAAERSGGGGEERKEREEEEEDFVCLDESFFVNRDYELTTLTFGSHDLQLLCLQSASTDYDLTGQLIWPGAMLLNTFLCKNTGILNGCSVIELGSGVGITGIFCSRFCHEVVLTDHNDEVLEILKKNIELQASLQSISKAGLTAVKLEWGDAEHISQILQKYPNGFDIILGADICFQQSSIGPLFFTVQKLLETCDGHCRFILSYVSRSKIIDEMVITEAVKHGMQVKEEPGTRTVISNLEGVIFEITLDRNAS